MTSPPAPFERPGGGPPAVPDLTGLVPGPPEERRAGCLKWGLVGCAGLAAALIVGLLVLAGRANTYLGQVLRDKGGRVVAAATDVPEERRQAFQTALGAFVAAAQDQSVGSDVIGAFSRACDDAVKDGTVSAEELEGLLAKIGDGGIAVPTPPPSPAAGQP